MKHILTLLVALEVDPAATLPAETSAAAGSEAGHHTLRIFIF